MREFIFITACVAVVVGLVGLVVAVRELVLYEHYTPPKRKRRATYIKPKR